MSRILVTGSRYWYDQRVMERALTNMADLFGRIDGEDPVIVHGGAKGADDLAGHIAILYGWATEVYHAEWTIHGKAAGSIRNQVMVDTAPDVCLAFPRSDSVGTWDCVRRAENAGIPVFVFTSCEDHLKGLDTQNKRIYELESRNAWLEARHTERAFGYDWMKDEDDTQ